MATTSATALAKMSKLEEKRNKKHTYLELKIMIPTNQGTTSQKSENEIRAIFRKDAVFNLTMERSDEELWQGQDNGGIDPAQGKIDID